MHEDKPEGLLSSFVPNFRFFFSLIWLSVIHRMNAGNTAQNNAGFKKRCTCLPAGFKIAA